MTPPDEIPSVVKVAQTSLAYGFAKDISRAQLMVPAFQITKSPITHEQYEACVEAGACKESKREGCSAEAYGRLAGHSVERADSPATCVAPAQAASYCGWIGGRLPSLPEWMLAARGAEPHVFAWGDTAPSCAQHPRAAETQGAFLNEAAAQEAGCVPAAESPLVVGAHEDGASPFGMQDVLLVPGELVAPRSASDLEGCSSDLEGCFVYGREPGAIEAAYPLSKGAAARDALRSPHVYGFRCVVERKQHAH